jgi:hypothetical protein
MSRLEFTDEPVEAPAPSETMVVRSYRIPLDLDTRIQHEAETRGTNASDVVRRWLASQAVPVDDDEPISRTEVMEAVALVRSFKRSA